MEDIICFGLILMQLGALVASVERWRRVVQAPFCADSWLSLTGRVAIPSEAAEVPRPRPVLAARSWKFWLFGSELALGLALALTLYVLFADPSWRWVALAALSAHLGVGVWFASLAADRTLAPIQQPAPIQSGPIQSGPIHPAAIQPAVVTFDKPAPVFVRARDEGARERDFEEGGFRQDQAAWPQRRDDVFLQQTAALDQALDATSQQTLADSVVEPVIEPVVEMEEPIAPADVLAPAPAQPLDASPVLLAPNLRPAEAQREPERVLPPRIFDYRAAAATFASAVAVFGAGRQHEPEPFLQPAEALTVDTPPIETQPIDTPPIETLVIEPSVQRRALSGGAAGEAFHTAAMALACPPFAAIDDEAQPSNEALVEPEITAEEILAPVIAPAIITAPVITSPIITSPVITGPVITGPAVPARAVVTPPVVIRHGVVAAGHRVTVSAAQEILADGGTAIDAALAAMMAACVAEPLLAGPAGGGFLIAYAPGEEPVLYDFFCATPGQLRAESEQDFREVHADFGPATQGFHIGAAAAAVPGFAAGLMRIHQERATLPLARLAEPAIRAAKVGVTITAFQAYLLEVIRSIVTASPEARALFAPSGSVLSAGAVMVNPGLADALDGLAREGLTHFTTGPVGQAIIAQSADHGGHLRADDLADYAVITRRPLFWGLGAAELALNPSPAQSGPRIAMALGILEKAAPGGLKAPHTAAVIAEALAEADRAYARHAQSPLRLASSDLIAQHASALAETLALHPAQTRGTTHISVMDAAGRAASVTLSNGEGNGLMVGCYGFMMNNMLGEADLNPGGYQQFQPRVRLASMMAPSLMSFDDGTLVALGSGGSSRIRSAIIQVAARLVAGMRLEDAIAAPRVHVEGADVVSFEDHLPQADRANLLAAWPEAHAWADRNMFFGGVHAAIRTPNGQLLAVADARRDGAVGQA